VCGILGVFGHPEAANLTYLGLHSLQHRGQESAGIVTLHEGRLNGSRRMGLVADAFTEEDLSRLPGNHAIGHVRYSTAGGSLLKNAQPMWIDYVRGPLAIAHNGNLVNAESIRRRLEGRGSIFQTSMDTECIVHLIAQAPQDDLLKRIRVALEQVEGAYSLLFLTPEGMVAVRDPNGFRPLMMGRLNGATVFASETCAMGLIGAEPEREVLPGEAILVTAEGREEIQLLPPSKPTRCAFEHVYFSRPDSHVFGNEVYSVRRKMGRKLAAEQPADVDVVVPVPDSGVTAALGFSEALRRPFEMGLLRSHYVGRTFIEPQKSIRDFGVKLKLYPVRGVIEGRRVAVVDDSIVRGTTSRKIVAMLRQVGAAEVHFRVSSPPTRWPCYYGIDTPTREDLIAARMDVDEIARYLGADSLGFLSRDGLMECLGEGGGPPASGGAGQGGPAESESTYCDACWSGEYSIPIADR